MSFRKYIIIQVLIILPGIFISCDREVIRSGYPNVITVSVEEKDDAVVFSGELIRNEKEVDETGFIWQTGNDPAVKPGFRVKANNTGSGTFSAEASYSVSQGQNYVLRSYARCGETIIYGESLSFQTDLILPCKLGKIEPDSAFRGDTIKLTGEGFNMTMTFNTVMIDGKVSKIVEGNDTLLVCIVPDDIRNLGSKPVKIFAGGIEKDFGEIFFLLLSPAPELHTIASHDVTSSSATLQGSVNPNSNPCSVSFEYGTTTAYGHIVSADPCTAGGDTLTTVYASLRNLSPNTTYHCRIKTVSEWGAGFGNDLTFITPELPPEPVINSLSSTSVKYGELLTINGQYLDGVTGFLLGDATHSIRVVPKTVTPNSVEIEIYNQEDPYQVLGYSSFRIGLVHPLSTTWSDPVTIESSWTRMADLPASGRYKAGCFCIDGKIYIGCGAGPGVFNDFWRFNIEANNWTRLSDFPGTGRIYPASQPSSLYGYMGSGFSADNSTKTQLYDFYKYDPGTDSWNTIPVYPDNITDFFIGYSASVNGRPFFGLSNTSSQMREIVGDIWTVRNGVSNLLDNTGAATFTIGNSFYVMAGYSIDGTINKEVWKYNTSSGIWTRKADFPGSPRHVAISFSVGVYGYYGCGRGLDPNTQYKDMWRYDPATDKWIRMEDFPGGNRSHTVSASDGNFGFTGLGIYIGNLTYLKDFWKFNPGN